jgi:hypothetical protein
MELSGVFPSLRATAEQMECTGPARVPRGSRRSALDESLIVRTSARAFEEKGEKQKGSG